MLRTKLSFDVPGIDAQEITQRGWKVISDFYKVDAQKIQNEYDIDLTVSVRTNPDGTQFFIGSFLVKPKSFSYNIPQMNLTK